MADIISDLYSLGSKVLPLTKRSANILGSMFGIKTVYGWREKDPFPDHPSGHAADFMVPDVATGDALAAYAIEHADELGVKYIVWNRRGWNAKRKTWEPYSSTPNPHTDHVHITFNDTNSFGSTDPGLGLDGVVTDVLGKVLAPAATVGDVLRPIGIAGANLVNPNFWRRIGMGVVGGSLLLVGLVFVNRQRIGDARRAVAGFVGGTANTALQGAAFGAGAGATGGLGGGRPTSGGGPGGGPLRPPPRPPAISPRSVPPNAPTTAVLPASSYAPVSPGGTYSVTGVARRPSAPLPDLGPSSVQHLGGRGKPKFRQSPPLWRNPLERSQGD